MNELPKVSVVIPTRNRAPYLKRVLDNLFSDDYSNTEVIVVDGASTDGTVALLKSYGSRINRWVSEPDGGEYYAWNKGILLATGEIIKPMTDDDVLRPGSIRLAVDYLLNHPEVDLLFGQALHWRKQGEKETPLYTSQMNNPKRMTARHLLNGTARLCSPTAFIRHRVFASVGLMSVDYSNGDTEFWLRCASRGIQFAEIPEVMLDYYFTGENGIVTKRWQLFADRVRLYAKYGNKAELVFWMSLYFLATLLHQLGLHPTIALRRWHRAKSAQQTAGL
jgi:glycosyltransferase involved in cell wall biosynthesis